MFRLREKMFFKTHSYAERHHGYFLTMFACMFVWLLFIESVNSIFTMDFGTKELVSKTTMTIFVLAGAVCCGRVEWEYYVDRKEGIWNDAMATYEVNKTYKYYLDFYDIKNNTEGEIPITEEAFNKSVANYIKEEEEGFEIYPVLAGEKEILEQYPEVAAYPLDLNLIEYYLVKELVKTEHIWFEKINPYPK